MGTTLIFLPSFLTNGQDGPESTYHISIPDTLRIAY
jgi:hypothetical protein